MRPYLAVIKDSFREALATRVLWIMLILIGVLLAALAPFGYRDAVAISLQFSDIREPALFVRELRQFADDPKTPAGHVWSKLSQDLRNELSQLEPDNDRNQRARLLGQLRNELNQLITQPNFYDTEVWKNVTARNELQDLLKVSEVERTSDQTGRLNRLALDAAFPDAITPAGTQAIQAVYFGNELGDEFPITKEQMQVIVTTVLSQLVSRLLGNIGVFIAILVTASIIPQMLDAGAIDLLLSKPISRPLLFLSKFVGGCGFILMCATLMIVGLWLIVGWRFDIWSTGLLWTIPVFVFVFAVYYSVSTLAAVIWRNAVVSIVISILFWATCFTVGFAKTQADLWFLNPRRTAAIIPTSDSVLVTTKRGSGFEWNSTEKTWQELFQERRRGPAIVLSYPFVGPILDETSNRLLAIRVPEGRMRWLQSSATLVVASGDKDWKPAPSITVPSSTTFLGFNTAGTPIIAGMTGIHEIQGDVSKEQKGFQFLGFGLPNGDGARLVRLDESQRPVWREPFAVGYDAAADQFAVVSGDSISVLRKNAKDRYEISATATRPNSEPALVTLIADIVVIAERDGTLRQFDAKTLKEQHTAQPQGTNEPHDLQAAMQGGSPVLVVVYHNRHFAVLDAKLNSIGTPIVGQGDVSAVQFSGGGLFVSDRIGRVTRYDIDNQFKQSVQYEPESDFLEKLYHSVIHPLHTVFPKPGDMENLVRWLMTNQETAALDDGRQDLGSERIILDVWQPLWSNLAFLAVVLGFTCIYISRRDF